MKLLYLLEQLRTPQLDTVMYTVTQLGGVLVFVVLTLAVFWCVDRRCGLFLMAAGLAGWGGVSVHCQTMAVLGDSGLRAAPCVAGKAVQGLLSSLMAALLCPWVLGA